MENASKALIMAGNVLIALMILGALLLMFNSLSAYQKATEVDTTSEQLVEINAQFETYNRTDIRGSDLYSLLNRAINYNTRQTTAGVGKEGEEIAFQPITITFSFSKNDLKELTPDGTNRLIKSSTYSTNGMKNDFYDKINEKVEEIEDTYGQATLTNWTTALTRIFIDTEDKEEQKKAVDILNKASKGNTTYTWNDIKPGKKLREDVYAYYEFIQFKRAHFDCKKDEKGTSGVEYDKNTGRIISMNFIFNGTIE